MRRAAPDVVYSTTGKANPNLHSRSDYQYRNRPGWPDDPATRDDGGKIEAPMGGTVARKAQRERMLDEFTVARLNGLSVKDAGERVGVTWKTARRYEEDRLAAQAGTPS